MPVVLVGGGEQELPRRGGHAGPGHPSLAPGTAHREAGGQMRLRVAWGEQGDIPKCLKMFGSGGRLDFQMQHSRYVNASCVSFHLPRGIFACRSDQESFPEADPGFQWPRF